jgi:single-strand DNA-binding protein
MYQKTILIGRIGEIKPSVTKNNKSITQYSVATSKSVKDKVNNEWTEITEWHRIVSYDKCAELIRDKFEVGDLLALEGELSTNKWDDSKGVTHYTTQLVVRDFPKKLPRFFSRAPQNGDSSQPAAASFYDDVSDNNYAPSFASYDDEVPFI